MRGFLSLNMQFIHNEKKTTQNRSIAFYRLRANHMRKAIQIAKIASAIQNPHAVK